MELHPLIEINPRKMLGKPIIKGTRITVEQILEELSANFSISDILIAHPQLTEAHISAALSFAAQAIKGDVVYPVENL